MCLFLQVSDVVHEPLVFAFLKNILLFNSQWHHLVYVFVFDTFFTLIILLQYCGLSRCPGLKKNLNKEDNERPLERGLRR